MRWGYVLIFEYKTTTYNEYGFLLNICTSIEDSFCTLFSLTLNYFKLFDKAKKLSISTIKH